MSILSSTRRSAVIRHHLRHLCTSPTPSLSGGPHAFDPTLRRLVRSQSFSQIESILEPLKPQNPNSENLNSIITSYAASGMLDHALRTLSQIPNPTSLPFNALLSACNHNQQLFRQVPTIFRDLIKSHSFVPDKISYGILIKSYCKAKNAMQCFEILKQMKERNVEVTTVTYTTILDSLYKERKFEEAEKLWGEMMEKNVELDVAVYNVRVMNKALVGKNKEVMEVVEEMKSKGLEPDVFTFNLLIERYCRDKMFDEAKKVYDEMEVRNFCTYRNYMMGLVKNGRLEQGLEVFNESVKEKKVPDLGSVKVLVRRLMSAKKVRAAKRAVTGLRKKFSGDFGGGWLELEKIVGVDKDGDEEDATVLAV